MAADAIRPLSTNFPVLPKEFKFDRLLFENGAKDTFVKATGRSTPSNERTVPSEYQTWTLENGQYVDSLNRGLKPNISVNWLTETFLKNGAKVIWEENNVAVIKFADGPELRVGFDENRFITFLMPTKNIYGQRFLSTLNAAEIQTLFAKNSYYKQELAVQKRGRSFPLSAPPSLKVSEVEGKFQSGILMIPDLHGEAAQLSLAKKVIEKTNIDWFGLEMVPHTLQESLDDFCRLPSGDSKWEEAKQTLVKYISDHWGHVFPNEKKAEDHPYFQVIDLCRQKKIRAIGLDVEHKYYFNNPQASWLVVSTRNLVWVEQLPQTGKGAVYGGAWHFERHAGITIQDFSKERFPTRALQIVDFN